MKKLSILFTFIFSILTINAFCLQIQKVYSTKSACPLSSVYASTTTCISQIATPSVRIKQIQITNGAVAQKVSIYSVPVNYSTTTARHIMDIDVPASTTIFFPSTLANDEQNFDIPYFAVGTSTTTTPANVNVIYKD
jgi:hypothetical protein